MTVPDCHESRGDRSVRRSHRSVGSITYFFSFSASPRSHFGERFPFTVPTAFVSSSGRIPYDLVTLPSSPGVWTK
jgi:hypothetical protein